MRLIKTLSKTILLLFFPLTNSFAQLSEQQHADIIKNLDIYNSFFKELIINYVDTLNSAELTESAISSVLKDLDPYNEYIPSQDMQDFQFMTTGEYGGIGSVISLQNDTVIIRDPYEGMPAALSGLLPGDRILSIDGENIVGKDTKSASERLKGQPNTPLKIKFLRVGETKPREITVERKRIHIDPITYYGVLEEGIGYICLSTFTTESGQLLKKALLDLTSNNQITSLIIDVRGNGGGIVDECLDILNVFLPKGEVLLTMKGKNKQNEKIYRTTQSPGEPDLPLAILVDGSSASASEILAGAIQDMDRGVIVGNRTYGKGLVQSTKSLPYGGQLKVTTAKYYIPSERSIQRINYSSRNEAGDADVIPDSLTMVYYTKNNRPVRDGGGILPDFVIEEKKVPTMIYYLELKSIFFDFVVQWRAKHPKMKIAPPSDFDLTDDIYEEFKEFVKSKDFTYDLLSENRLENLKKTMEFEGYLDLASEELALLEQKIKPDLDRDLELHKEMISKYLAMNIMRQYYYHRGQQIYSLRNDEVLNKAIEVLSNNDLYTKTLQP